MNNQTNLDPGKTEAERFLRQPVGTLPTNTANVVKRVSTLENRVETLEEHALDVLFIDYWVDTEPGGNPTENEIWAQYETEISLEEVKFIYAFSNGVWNEIMGANTMPISVNKIYINRETSIQYSWNGTFMLPLTFPLSKAAIEALLTGDISSHKHTQHKVFHGIESYTATTFVNATKIFTIPACTYWFLGTKVICAVNTSINLTTYITANGNNKMYYIYFDDVSGIPKVSISAWNLKTMCPIDAIFWNGSAGALTREKHNHTRDIDWHINAHTFIGSRYISGMALSGLGNAATSFTWAVASGSTVDEDLIHTVDAHTQATKGARVWYQLPTGVWTFADTAYPYVWNAGTSRVQHPIPTTFALTDLATNRYIPIWVYANGGDKDRQIYFVLPTVASGTYTTPTLARGASAPDLSTTGWAQEAKLIHKIIVDGSGAAQPYAITTDDLRNVSSLPSGGSAPSNAAQISVVPTTGVLATNQQSFDAEIADMFYGRNVTLAAYDIDLSIGENFTKVYANGNAFTISNPIVGKRFRLFISGGTALTVPTFTGYTTTWIASTLASDYNGTAAVLYAELRSAGTLVLFWGE